MKKKILKKQYGFTLIELMVVISIIGLLASVVLASLAEARQSAKDAAIKQQVRSTAILFEQTRNETGSYLNYQQWRIRNDGIGEICSDKTWLGPNAAQAEKLCEGITAQVEYEGVILQYGVDFPFRDGTHYSIAAQLNNGNWYCVGSSGGTYEGPFNPGTGNWTGAGCYANP